MLHSGASSPATEDAESPSHGTGADSPAARWSWLIPVATVLGFAIPIVAYLWMIHAYGVNVVYLDQWTDVILIGHAHSGTLHLATLWSQHYENRTFFPDLIVLALAYTTHFNVLTEEYLSAFMLFGATALLVCAHKRRSPERRWIWYCPVAFLLLSLAQAVNALFGFQMAWYLVLLMITLALFLLDREPQRWPVFGCAIGAAVIASFSSVQGLLVWPAGLLLIYLRRRPPRLAVAWIGAAVLAGVIYFAGFNFNVSQAPTPGPAAVLTFLVRVVGDIVGEAQPGVLVTLFGVVLVVLAIWVLVRFALLERTTTGGRPLALALILFGLLFSGLTAYGRSGAGALNVEDRYTVFAILVLVGLYLAVLDPPADAESGAPLHGAPSPRRGAGRGRHLPSDPLLALARVVVGVGIVLTVLFGSANGISQARAIHQNRVYLGRVTVRASQYPDPIVAGLSWLQPAQSIRRWIAIARDDNLSLFATGDAAKYLREPPIHFRLGPTRASVILPHDGSTVHGKQVLDVSTSGPYDITRVDYFLSGPGLAKHSFAAGVYTHYGWIAKWNTSTVPNGSYAVDATVSDAGGRTVTTPPIEVRVENAQ